VGGADRGRAVARGLIGHVTDTPASAPGGWRLFDGRGSLLTYCLIAWSVALVPTVLIVITAHYLFTSAGADVGSLQKPARDIAERNLAITLMIAPFVETLVLSLMLEGLRRVIRRALVAAVIAALAWAGLHAAFYPLWFFGTVWSFYVFSRGYLAWRPVSYKHAFGAAVLPHALVNASALLMQFAARG
jgi:hypothetical protein